MLMILIAIIFAIVAGSALLIYASGCNTGDIFAGIAGIFLVIFGGITAVTYAFVAWNWFAAESKANIINREYSANYTREEVFYASDVIDTIRQLDRKRIEINGDIMRDKPDSKDK